MKKPIDAIIQAAKLLGSLGYKARVKRHGARKVKAQMSAAGKAAAEKGVSGRPRLPDAKVKPNTLYQRARREKLKAKPQHKKGGK
jgi:hypothetical protein